METTTIEVSVENWQWLSSLKERPGDSFDDVLSRLREQYEDKEAFQVAMERDTSEFLVASEDETKTTDDGLETATAGHNDIEDTTMDAGEALFGDVVSEVPADLDLPGSGDTFERRRETIGKLYAYLQEHETATRSDFVKLIDPDDVGYASADSFWSNSVKGRDSLSSLDGVVPPSEGGHTWRYEPEQ